MCAHTEVCWSTMMDWTEAHMVKKRLCAHSHTEVCWSSLMDWNPLTWEGQGEGLLQFFQVSKNGQSSRHPTGLCGHSTYIKAVTHLQFHKHLRSKDVMAGGCGKQSVLCNPFSPYCRFRFPQRIEVCALQVQISSENCLKEFLPGMASKSVFWFRQKIASKGSLREWPQRVCTAGSGFLREWLQRVCAAGFGSLREWPQSSLREWLQRVPSEFGLKECVLQVLVPSENCLKLKECTAGSDSLRELPQKEV